MDLFGFRAVVLTRRTVVRCAGFNVDPAQCAPVAVDRTRVTASSVRGGGAYPMRTVRGGPGRGGETRGGRHPALVVDLPDAVPAEGKTINQGCAWPSEERTRVPRS